MTYSLIAVFDEIIKENIAPYLKKQGFKKQHLNFYKTEGDLIFVINFQKNSYNSVDYVSFFINCGIYSSEIMRTIGESVLPNPKEYQCLFSNRINHLSGSKNKDFELTSSDENSKKTLANTLILELKAAVNFYETIQTTDNLVDVCIEKGTYFWQEFLRYLAIKKDLKRLAQYVKNFGNIFKGDERRAWFETEINRILVENGVEKMFFEEE